MGEIGYHVCQGRATEHSKVDGRLSQQTRTNGAQMSGFQPGFVIPGEVIHTRLKDFAGSGVLNSAHRLKLSVNMDINTHWSTLTPDCSQMGIQPLLRL